MAIRAAAAMVATLTPSLAASSGRGLTTTSGPVGGVVKRGSATPGMSRISRCSSSAVASRFSPVSLVRMTETPAAPKPELSKLRRASGIRRSSGRMRSRICPTRLCRSGLRMAVTEPLVIPAPPPPKPGPPPPPPPAPTVLYTASVSGWLAISLSTLSITWRMSAMVEPGGASTTTV